MNIPCNPTYVAQYQAQRRYRSPQLARVMEKGSCIMQMSSGASAFDYAQIDRYSSMCQDTVYHLLKTLPISIESAT